MLLHRLSCTAALCAIAAAAAVRLDAQTSSAQVPPSIRSSAVRGAPPRLSEAEQNARCTELKALIDALKPEATTALRKREVADLERMRGGLACAGAGVLRGRWNLEGTPADGSPAIRWTMELTAIDKAAGQAMTKENWGGYTAMMCGQSPDSFFFYRGTVEFRNGPAYNTRNPFQLWPDGAGTVLVCVYSGESGTGWAYLRDAQKGRSFHMQFTGDATALAGDVIPAAPIAGPMRFKGTR